MRKYKIGQLVRCKVSGITDYGIFVIKNEYQGLIHISEISNDFIKNINDYAMVGDYLYAKIIDINEKEHKLKLSIRSIDYKTKENIANNLESKNGFIPLKNNLPVWTKEKIKEYKIESIIK